MTSKSKYFTYQLFTQLSCCALVVWQLASAVVADDQLLNRKGTPARTVSQTSTAMRPSLGPAPVRTANKLELRFKAAPRTERNVVTLGDLVEVVSWGPRTQEDILLVPLAPAPGLGVSQAWTAKDLLHHLELRGISGSDVRWQGPESAQLVRGQPEAAKPKINRDSHTPAFVQERTIAQAEANVIQATREYLWLKTGERTDWRIKVQVPVQYAQTLAGRRNIVSLDGGEVPWTGQQVFTYVVRHEGEELELDLELNVDLPPMVVVAVHSLRREDVVKESDLALAPLPQRSTEQIGDFYESPEEVVGKQLRRSVATGQPVGRAMIGEPVVISSGELIEIESVSGPVSVKVAGKALSGGAVGELINIELVSSRKRLQATVVGPLQARIAGAPPIIQGKSR